MKFVNLNFLEPSGPLQACKGTALPLPYTVKDDSLHCSTLEHTNSSVCYVFSCRPLQTSLVVSCISTSSPSSICWLRGSDYIYYRIPKEFRYDTSEKSQKLQNTLFLERNPHYIKIISYMLQSIWAKTEEFHL